MKKPTKATVIMMILFSLATGFIANSFIYFMEHTEGENWVEQLNYAAKAYGGDLMGNLMNLSHTKMSLVCGFCAFVAVWLFFLYNLFSAKNTMPGKEHGSAQWSDAKTAKLFKDVKNEDNNLILSDTEFLRLKGRTDFEYDRNKNIIVIGGSGSGKSRLIAKPNILQMHSSYIITDPKGTLLPETGRAFEKNGYEIRVFNTINFLKSLHYNPFAYIHSEKDILKLVDVLIKNTNGEGEKRSEDFWVKSERLWYSASIAYLYYEVPEEDRNIMSMIALLDASQVKEDNEDYVSPVDVLFQELEEEKPNCFAVKQYKKFKLAAGKTMKSILISCGARLAPFDIEELSEIMRYDELELDKIGDRKTAFYVIMSDTDTTFNFLIAMIFYQTFNLLCTKADEEYGGTLPVHVRCIFDEFANIGKIPNFQNLISTIRSREISAMIILQSMTQLKSAYKDDAETIVDCCDTTIFLGGKSTETRKSISEMIGQTTIDNQNINESKGQQGSYSLNNQVLGRALIDPSEVGRLSRSECLVLITGVNSFKSNKYRLEKHRRYSELGDFKDPKLIENIFDITKYMEKNRVNEEKPKDNLPEILPEMEIDKDEKIMDMGELEISTVPELNDLAL